jgi:PAS domain S-box-containing protein
VSTEAPTALRKRIRITNRLSVVNAAMATPFIALFAVSGYPAPGAALAVATLIYASVPWLNARGHHGWARLVMLFFANALPVAFAVLFGQDTGIQLFLLGIIGLPAIVCDPRRRRSLALLTMIPAILLLGLEATNCFGIRPLPLAPGFAGAIRIGVVLMTCATRFSAVSLILEGNADAERALAETVARFDSIFTHVQDIVFLVDRNGRCQAVNPPITRFGLDPGAVVGRTFDELVSPDVARALADALGRATAAKAAVTFEGTWEGRKLHVTISPVLDDGGAVSGLVGLARDVTSERQIEGALRAARDAADAASNAKTFFLANVSHELRTPLAVISGFAELLSGSVTNDADARAVATIRRNSQHLGALVGDILDVALVESGKLRILPEASSVPAALAGSLAVLRDQALAKGLAFDVVYAPDLPTVVHLDPVRLRQIVTNVVGNAVKFTASGNIRVDVDTAPCGRLLLRVKDTGCGIDPATADALFQPFTQADASTSRRYGGTGLGLALSRSLARALGGDVVLAASALDQGATFEITLATGSPGPHPPHERSAAAAPPQAAASLDAPPSTPSSALLAGARILVIDDTPDIRVMLHDALTMHGATVDAAGDGTTGLALATAAAYDVIFMDIQLPGLDGYEATRRLRAAGVASAVIALTGRASQGEQRACLDAGCDDFLAKPVSLAQLVTTAARWRAGQSAPGANAASVEQVAIPADVVNATVVPAGIVPSVQPSVAAFTANSSVFPLKGAGARTADAAPLTTMT